jgi:hypothetical protein
VDEIVGLAAFGEVFFGVIDDVVGPQRLHEIDIPGVADRGHLGADVFGELDRRRSDRAGGAVDQHLLPVGDLSGAEILEGVAGAFPGWCGLLVPQVAWERGDHPVGRDGQVLGVGAEGGGVQPDDVIPDVEGRDVLADGDDLAGELVAEDWVLGPAQAIDQTGDERAGAKDAAVCAVDGGGVDLDQEFVRFGSWFVDVRELEGAGRAVSGADDCFHWVPSICQGTTSMLQRSARVAPREGPS